ncbi:hypothetical protein [Paucisalibacillus globulus]|uniref:hypothetical protein n=1 Tax=Paucisalibacillus globulus TaxID=351095 RepID=UPI003F8F89E0
MRLIGHKPGGKGNKVCLTGHIPGGGGNKVQLIGRMPGGEGNKDQLIGRMPGGKGNKDQLIGHIPGWKGNKDQLIGHKPGGKGNKDQLIGHKPGGKGNKVCITGHMQVNHLPVTCRSLKSSCYTIPLKQKNTAIVHSCAEVVSCYSKAYNWEEYLSCRMITFFTDINVTICLFLNVLTTILTFSLRKVLEKLKHIHHHWMVPPFTW